MHFVPEHVFMDNSLFNSLSTVYTKDPTFPTKHTFPTLQFQTTNFKYFMSTY